MTAMERRTLVMGTVTPARSSEDMLRRLCAAGMCGVRINSAHVEPDGLRELIRRVREVAPEIKILMDTKGPEMRTTDLETGVEEVILATDTDIIVTGAAGATTAGEIHVNVTGLGTTLHPRDILFIDDGAIKLTVSGIVDADTVRCTVIIGGSLGSRKGIGAGIGAKLPQLPAVSERDRRNIAVALEENIDMIAHSFVRNADDVAALRAVVGNSSVEVYAKIECREAVDNLEEIAAASDGLLVARGDLGAQIALERVPAIQARALELAGSLGRPSIIATQILASMMHSPVPTRAEASDIALGVMQGARWLLLTGETAVGEYPVECVDFMTRVIAETDNYLCSCNGR